MIEILTKIHAKITIIVAENRELYYFIIICKCKQIPWCLFSYQMLASTLTMDEWSIYYEIVDCSSILFLVRISDEKSINTNYYWVPCAMCIRCWLCFLIIFSILVVRSGFTFGHWSHPLFFLLQIWNNLPFFRHFSMNGKYRYLSITISKVSIFSDTSLCWYFSSLVKILTDTDTYTHWWKQCMGTMFSIMQQYYTGTHSSLWEEPRQPYYWGGRPKTFSIEIMVNTIEAVIMEGQSLMVRELGPMLDNFCTSFLFCEIW